METDEKIMKHNDPYVDEICEAFKDNQRILFTAGTGVGKSYVGRKVIERLYSNDSILIIVPNNSLKPQWMKYLKGYDNIEIQTSAYVINMTVNRSYKYYKLIILDECHQSIGAPTWGKCALDLIDTLDCNVLGLTATELRYRDGVNIEVFFNKHVVGIPLNEAIDRGIVNTFTYVSCYFDAEKDIHAIRAYAKSKYTKNDPEYYKLDKRLCIEESKYKIENIIKNNMPDDQRKVIVFYKDYTDLDHCKEIMNNIYPDADCYEVSYEYTKEQNEDSIKKFENSDAKISIIYSVNILGQGLHINAVDTVVMLRRTKSQQIFFQQLGRLISLVFSKDKENVLFDIMANAHSVEPVCLDDYSNLRMVGSVDREVKFSDKVVSKDYRRECAEMLKEVYNKLDDTIIIAEFCKEHAIKDATFYRYKYNFKFTTRETMDYILGLIPNPNGNYHKPRNLFRSKAINELGVTGGAYDSVRSRHGFSDEEAYRYLKCEIPNRNGHYYKPNKNLFRSKAINELGVTGDAYDSIRFRSRHGFSDEEAYRYLKGEIPNRNGNYYKPRTTSNLFKLKAISELGVNDHTYYKTRKCYGFTDEETYRYLKGEIPNHNGHYYRPRKNPV